MTAGEIRSIAFCAALLVADVLLWAFIVLVADIALKAL
jgi:hypothetical protein